MFAKRRQLRYSLVNSAVEKVFAALRTAFGPVMQWEVKRMKKTGTRWILGIATAAAVGLSAVEGSAQLAPPAPGLAVNPGMPGAAQAMDPSKVLRIRKVPRLGSRDWLQRTPVFAGSASRGKPREWGVFEVVYDTAPEWIDELTVSFTLMLQATDPALQQQPFTVCRLTCRYIDVAKGNDKVASAILLPSALLRYGRPIGFAAEFSVNGQVVGSEAAATEAFLKDKWWENAAIMDSPRTVKREGYLLDRIKTPFGLVNIDENEVSK